MAVDRPSSRRDIEQNLAEMAARAHVRLRFDKVALRVVGLLQDHLTAIVPDGEIILFAITAPIRRPAMTVAVMKTLAQDGRSGARVRHAVHGNDVRLRWIGGVLAPMPSAIGFVHHPASDAELLLDLAQARFTGIA